MTISPTVWTLPPSAVCSPERTAAVPLGRPCPQRKSPAGLRHLMHPAILPTTIKFGSCTLSRTLLFIQARLLTKTKPTKPCKSGTARGNPGQVAHNRRAQ